MMKNLTKKELGIWISSLLVIAAANVLSGNLDLLTLAALQNPVYLSVIVIFMIFLFYDIYGFVNWKKRERAM